jgi:hypothetical protein
VKYIKPFFEKLDKDLSQLPRELKEGPSHEAELEFTSNEIEKVEKVLNREWNFHVNSGNEILISFKKGRITYEVTILKSEDEYYPITWYANVGVERSAARTRGDHKFFRADQLDEVINFIKLVSRFYKSKSKLKI